MIRARSKVPTPAAPLTYDLVDVELSQEGSGFAVWRFFGNGATFISSVGNADAFEVFDGSFWSGGDFVLDVDATSEPGFVLIIVSHAVNVHGRQFRLITDPEIVWSPLRTWAGPTSGTVL